MDMEKIVINIKGVDYEFLKPFPITMVNIEKKCAQSKNFVATYEDEILKLINKKLRKEDLVTFSGKDITLSNGIVLSPMTISYRDYEKMVAKFEEEDAVKIVKNYLEICGQDKLDINSLTKEDIYAIMDAYTSLYDRTVLNDVLERMSTFC